MTTIHNESFADLAPDVLYALLKLRSDVFVVEQGSIYPDLDGRDTEPGTRHLWINDVDGTAPLAYLRLLAEPDGTMRIGRVVTAPRARAKGLAGRLVTTALAVDPQAPTVLDAQTRLVGMYERFGFTVTGPEFLDGGIPHVPMRREPYGSPATRPVTSRRRPV